MNYKWIKLIFAGLATMVLLACGSNKNNKTNDTDNMAILYLNGSEYNISDANITAAKSTDRDGKQRAYHFDGSNKKDMIVIPHNDAFNITEQITLGAWVKIAQKHSGTILRKSAYATNVNNANAHSCPYELSVAANEDIVFSLSTGKNGNYSWVQLRHHGYPIGDWIHIAGTYDGSSMKLYINGMLEEEKTVSGTLSANSEPLYIGTRGGFNTWNGEISDVRLYSKALSDSEIGTLSK